MAAAAAWQMARRRPALAPVLLAVLVQLWRWWQRRRFQRRQTLAAAAAATPAGKPAEGCLLPLRPAALAAPARPGLDHDERFDYVDDDPRYFEGAELGKAQRAALGSKFSAGINTVSYDPASTLVRPSMRILHRGSGESMVAIKPDDVLSVPGFFCEEGNLDFYERLAKDIGRLVDQGSADVSSSKTYQAIVRSVCARVGMTEARCCVRLRWHRHGADANPFFSAAMADEDDAGRAEVSANVTFGERCEHVFRRAGFDDKIAFPSRNGGLHVLGHDVTRRWQCELPVLPESSSQGMISISISGPSRFAIEESKLAPMPLATTAPLKGGGQVDGDAGCERPCMRVFTLADATQLESISHDDVIIIPEFFCSGDDWDIYYRLLREIREENQHTWESWHEGSHLLTKRPQASSAYRCIIDKICDLFVIANKDSRDGNSVGTRFNWYRDGADWKPFHHDSAAFNAQRAQLQNCTVGVSFGAPRELAFRHAKTGELLYFPQTNGMVFFFGRDVNIRWQHGINALPADEQDGKGRISIILWGLTTLAVEEAGSPSMLVDSAPSAKGGKGQSKGQGKGQGKGGVEHCRAFLRGSCSHGDRCKYLHAGASGGTREVCRNYQRDGNCNYGGRCRFAHVGGA